jgi:nucleotide-binding universal stress UspA family protein
MNAHAESRPIVVGVDGSPQSIEALREAAELARLLDAPLQALNAWQFPVGYDGGFPKEMWSPEAESERLLESAIGAAFPDGRPAGLAVTSAAGPAAGVLVDKSREACMLVLGSRGRGGFAGLLLGSVSTSCAQHAHCPVLIMHGPARRTDALNPDRARDRLQPTI